MDRPASTADVAVIGAGPIGASIAWRCAQRGLSVALCDPRPARGAWRTAAGMLAPVTELTYTETRLHQLGIHSLRRYPAFVAELEDATGLPCGLLPCGTVSVAWDAADLRALQDLARFGARLGIDGRMVSGRELRALEPALAPGLPGGMYVPGDHQIDPRLLHAALLAACQRVGVQFVWATASVVTRHDRVVGVATRGGGIGARHVVLAAGAWSARVPGVPADATPGIRPVKGTTLRLRLPAPAAVRPVVRADVKGSHVYVVPRADGGVVVGASVEEAGFDTTPLAGVVYQLLRDAQSVLPELSEAVLEEVSTGLRPGSPDNAPLLGPSAVPGLVMATGHYRNGILLTPVTADAVTDLLDTGAIPESVRGFGVDRFAAVAG